MGAGGAPLDLKPGDPKAAAEARRELEKSFTTYYTPFTGGAAFIKEEMELLRLRDESRALENEMYELQIKHCATDDAAQRLEDEIAALDVEIETSARARKHLEEHGVMPPLTLPSELPPDALATGRFAASAYERRNGSSSKS